MHSRVAYELSVGLLGMSHQTCLCNVGDITQRLYACWQALWQLRYIPSLKKETWNKGSVCLFYIFVLWDKVFLCSPGWPEIHYADQAGLKLTKTCLPLTGNKGVQHYIQCFLFCFNLCIAPHASKVRGQFEGDLELFYYMSSGDQTQGFLGSKHPYSW